MEGGGTRGVAGGGQLLWAALLLLAGLGGSHPSVGGREGGLQNTRRTSENIAKSGVSRYECVYVVVSKTDFNTYK